MDQIRLDPQDKLPPTPHTRCQQNTLPPTGQKSACGPRPQDNFWNSPKAIQSVFDRRKAKVANNYIDTTPGKYLQVQILEVQSEQSVARPLYWHISV